MHIARRSLLGMVPVLLLGGCDDEPAQRKAFAAFLQARIVGRPGIRVPQPTAEETKAWGPYTRHYAVITDFNDAMTRRVSQPMSRAVERGALHSLQDIVARRSDLEDVRAGMRGIQAALGEELAKAEAARAALPMPADLKPTYDAAFERDVSGLARTMQEVLPVMDGALEATLAVADYIAAHPGTVQVQGMAVRVSDPAVQRELQAQMDALNAKGREVQAAQQRMRGLISGP